MATDATDRDETRRLLYMGLQAGLTKRYNLAGTLINALRHHQGVEDDELEDNVVALVNGTEDNAIHAWARGHIAAITAELEGS